MAIPNHLNSQFAVTEPDQTRCGDVTCIRTGKRRAYQAVVLDLFSRKATGRAMSFSPDSGLTGKALRMAGEARENRLTSCIILGMQGIQTVTVALSYKAKHELTRELPGHQPDGTIFSQPEIRTRTGLWIR